MYKIISFLFCFSLILFFAPSANAQSRLALEHATSTAAHCPSNWGNQACLQTLSKSAFDMVTNYGGLLKQNEKPKAAEYLKEHCAASTAGTKQDDIPAYAYRSAFTECLNAISEINRQLDLAPDATLYQLLTVSTLCLTKGQEKSCSVIEQQLVDTYK